MDKEQRMMVLFLLSYHQIIAINVIGKFNFFKVVAG